MIMLTEMNECAYIHIYVSESELRAKNIKQFFFFLLLLVLNAWFHLEIKQWRSVQLYVATRYAHQMALFQGVIQFW